MFYLNKKVKLNWLIRQQKWSLYKDYYIILVRETHFFLIITQ